MTRWVATATGKHLMVQEGRRVQRTGVVQEDLASGTLLHVVHQGPSLHQHEELK